ncbi:DsbA family protein [Haladaptatus paucihalophilus]|uniref:Thioredoxin n=2 Tax=Haladaptatus paucihalophilus DX253 TaxID=797209 RepID=A0A1M7BWN7_HALPU|nr:thioredoxin domain-containing protein [Haladaptatus paucihalophilus]SHL59286.1 Thioredoxin [Haladaptatus paucihalophilus DX253]
MRDVNGLKSRRLFLGTVAGSLSAIAGCTSILPSSSNDSDTGGTTSNHSSNRNSTSLLYATEKTTKFGIDLQGNPVIGAADAPLDLYYWSDYQCPFCQKFEQNTFDKILNNYVKSSDVRIVVLEKPYIGQASETAAQMAKCVWRTVRNENPDAFKRWHSTMFDKQGKENSRWAQRSNLLEITDTVQGVDATAVASCMKRNKDAVRASIDDDIKASETNGIRGTPAFIIVDRKSTKAGKLVGAQPYSLFKKAFKKVDNA